MEEYAGIITGGMVFLYLFLLFWIGYMTSKERIISVIGDALKKGTKSNKNNIDVNGYSGLKEIVFYGLVSRKELQDREQKLLEKMWNAEDRFHTLTEYLKIKIQKPGDPTGYVIEKKKQ